MHELALFLFICLEFFIPLESFSLIGRRHHCRRRAANFFLCSALMAIEQQRGFISVPHLLRHGVSFVMTLLLFFVCFFFIMPRSDEIPICCPYFYLKGNTCLGKLLPFLIYIYWQFRRYKSDILQCYMWYISDILIVLCDII